MGWANTCWTTCVSGPANEATASAPSSCERRSDGQLYLWVLEANDGGRRFYALNGGAEAETRTEELAPGVVVVERRVRWSLDSIT